MIDDPKFKVQNNDIQGLFEKFVEEYDNVQETSLSKIKLNVTEILTANIPKSEKQEQLLKNYPSEKKNTLFGNLIGLALGLTPNFKTNFSLENDAKLQISSESYEEDLGNLLVLIGENFIELFSAVKNLSDGILLAGIVSDESPHAPLSTKMVIRFKEHDEDLAALKQFIRNNLPEKYVEVFSDQSKDGYAGYVDGKTTQEAFYRYIKNLLSKFEGADYFLDKIEREDF